MRIRNRAGDRAEAAIHKLLALGIGHGVFFLNKSRCLDRFTRIYE
jgi:hypothetical protein